MERKTAEKRDLEFAQYLFDLLEPDFHHGTEVETIEKLVYLEEDKYESSANQAKMNKKIMNLHLLQVNQQHRVKRRQ